MRVPQIELKNVFKIYKDYKSHLETVALKGVDLEIYEGEIICIIGPSGSGKSTLLNMIAGLDLPSAGQVIHHIDSQTISISTLTKDERDQYRSEKIGFMQQHPLLLQNYNALENVQLGLKNQGIIKTKEKALQALEQLKVDHRFKSKPRQLSGGERQRVSLAAALVVSPTILLLDEPTGEVDRHTADDIIDHLTKVNTTRKITIIFVTHDKSITKIANRVFHISDGRLVNYEISGPNKTKITTDSYGRFRIPSDIMMSLNQPSMIGLEKISDNAFRLINLEITDTLSALEGHVVDREGRVKLPVNSESAIISVSSSGIDLIIGGNL